MVPGTAPTPTLRTPARVLLVEDDPGYALRARLALHADARTPGVAHARTLGEARTHLALHGADCIVLDLSLPDGHGLEVLTAVRAAAPTAAIVVLEGPADEELAVAALVAGAQGRFAKERLHTGALDDAVRRALGRLRTNAALGGPRSPRPAAGSASADLRTAIEHRELRVHFQPVVTLATGTVVGAEALLRWQHRTRGLLAAAEVVPLAEAAGLIVPVGRWVLQEAVRQGAAWTRDLARPLTVAINLSARELTDPRVPRAVGEVLVQAGVDPASICLDVPEAVAAATPEAVAEAAGALRDLGARVALDNFGTGDASLSLLKRLPLDVLKLDRSLIAGVHRDHENAPVVEAVIALARARRLSVIAEGVETAEEVEALLDLGCELGQGHRFSKPVTAEGFGAYLAAGASA